MADTAQIASETAEDEPLERTLGPKLLALFIIGDILGAGVYALTARWRARSEVRSGSRSSSRSWWRR